jgi:hypothetical protein
MKNWKLLLHKERDRDLVVVYEKFEIKIFYIEEEYSSKLGVWMLNKFNEHVSSNKFPYKS